MITGGQRNNMIGIDTRLELEPKIWIQTQCSLSPGDLRNTLDNRGLGGTLAVVAGKTRACHTLH